MPGFELYVNAVVSMCCFVSRSFIQHFLVKFIHIVASTYSSFFFFFFFCCNIFHCVTAPQFLYPSLLLVDICTVSSILAIRYSAAVNILYNSFVENMYDIPGVKFPSHRACICSDLLHIDNFPKSLH